jgi:hypothetical protein
MKTKTFIKVVNDVKDLIRLYEFGYKKLPLPFEFIVDGKKYKIAHIANDNVIIRDENKTEINFDELRGKEFIWNLNNITDYFKEYYIVDGSVFIDFSNVSTIAIIKHHFEEDDEIVYKMFVNEKFVCNIRIDEDYFGQGIELFYFDKWMLRYIINKSKENDNKVIL